MRTFSLPMRVFVRNVPAVVKLVNRIANYPVTDLISGARKRTDAER
jgi:hypothetical protein